MDLTKLESKQADQLTLANLKELCDSAGVARMVYCVQDGTFLLDTQCKRYPSRESVVVKDVQRLKDYLVARSKAFNQSKESRK